MAEQKYTSWGRYPQIRQQGACLNWRTDPLPASLPNTETLLPYGNGRSYGDVCLNRGGTVLDTRRLNRFISFDAHTGVLRCESGVLLDDILRLVVPQDWFLPVNPGTRFVTVGGALANDVHGKNHHKAGAFGCHVRAFELLRSSGGRLVCTPAENAELFAATIGGLGLTGLVTWVELQLRRIDGPALSEERIKFANLDEFFQLSDSSDEAFEYTVAWVDCIARGAALGRGLFTRANHVPARPALPVGRPLARFSLPFTPPASLVNRLSLQAFNAIYYGRQRQERRIRTVHYEQFFFPLDALRNWNLMYGPKGMLQYQCVLPGADGRDGMREMLRTIAQGGDGSFLAVLKIFGARPSPGMLSFPRPGVTLALDFPNRPEVFRLLDRLDDITRAAGGAVYPAKDARMSSESFQTYFPRWREFAGYIDGSFSSSFWRRVAGEAL